MYGDGNKHLTVSDVVINMKDNYKLGRINGPKERKVSCFTFKVVK